MNLANILGGSIGKVVGDLGKVVRSFVTTDGDRMELQMKFEEILARRDSEIEQTVRTELTAKQKIIEAEMASGDNFTKRARPMIIYAGLLFIGLNHVIFPMVGMMTGNDIAGLSLPTEFWYAWTGICGTYSIGRSMEKRGNRSRVTSFMTGN